ncbi:MAG TPA: hypothetical protein VIK01_29605 [Polyangiaceae bacterium]
MRWYVMSGTETIGPVGADLIAEYLKKGALGKGTFVRDEAGGAWMPVEQSPFSGMIVGRRSRIGAKPWPIITAFLVIATVAVAFWAVRGKQAAECERAEAAVHAKLAANDPAGARAARSAAWAACQDAVRLSELDRETVDAEAKVAAAASARRASLPSTISALRQWFENIGVDFERSRLADDTPRLFGQTPDNMTLVELIGHGDLLERASLTFGLSNELPPEVMVRNSGAIIAFMRETGWGGGQRWAIDSIGKSAVTETHNGVTYEMRPIGDVGVFVLSAQPSGY